MVLIVSHLVGIFTGFSEEFISVFDFKVLPQAPQWYHVVCVLHVPCNLSKIQNS